MQIVCSVAVSHNRRMAREHRLVDLDATSRVSSFQSSVVIDSSQSDHLNPAVVGLGRGAYQHPVLDHARWQLPAHHQARESHVEKTSGIASPLFRYQYTLRYLSGS
ncbi:hypothetical protein CDEST_04678 [Colletotrichum destructivum]|uniref:Uncharacterized protein n=1 Tax=Colletotrichum destructivum TaxID=34406 RepID=A0AAX4I8R3_9PEZI|nr:hypothetical protein CDEST_04678 [Colletotrichum destructivum]